jgi:hypothetical protein
MTLSVVIVALNDELRFPCCPKRRVVGVRNLRNSHALGITRGGR